MQALKQEFGTTHFKFVERQAGQPVIVFLNSLGSDARIWDDVLANGINQNSHLLMDFRGHGLSDVGDLPTFALSDLAADLKQLLDHLNIKKSGALWRINWRPHRTAVLCKLARNGFRDGFVQHGGQNWK